MKALTATSLFLSLFLGMTMISCGSFRSTNDNANAAANANAANLNSANGSQTPNDDVEALRNLVRVPFEPEEVVWRTFPSGPNGQRLVAVFRLSPEDSRAFAAKANAAGGEGSVQLNVEQWFPAELIAMGETTGETAVTGKAFSANDHFQPPFNVGTITVIPETDYVVLELKEK